MAKKGWMKGLGVQGWTGLRQSPQSQKETCPLGGMNRLASHGENPVNIGQLE